ncbi:MAG: tRNA (adenosine(37)-N6)-threonylcarbamoyltransferase complex ATPase subunit type 1 TsaE [Deltaproteobacteria bacterium]|jgi:tRNA threonylcarbamoyladenosine biosynthesis protein TsaE|nr:tRNA (adenosine(37)-N6)-threonylcarbamoyltransferase complex ATPase subunit type 1 TsaE [Deltaproteobacteria bacterium]
MAAAPLELFLPDESATRRAGFCLGQALVTLGLRVLTVTLRGELGAGKTTFCQGVGQALGVPTGEVRSPTFSLAHEHQGVIPFSHLDLYRLERDPYAEFLEAGLEESLAGVCLVEWAQRLPDSFWPLTRLDLTLTPASSGGRALRGRGLAPQAQKVWALLTHQYLAWSGESLSQP